MVHPQLPVCQPNSENDDLRRKSNGESEFELFGADWQNHLYCVREAVRNRQKPIEKMFKDMCRHEVTRDFLADNLMIQEVRDATMYDELELDKLGDRKTALFLIMSDTDSTFNFLISMIYTQLFNLLCDKADDQYGGKLPVHVRCLIDECANIGQIPQLEKLVATIRSREISACLVLQTRSQLKAIYKDNADTIVGNMDSQIFLGGSEPTTLKDLAEALGKETIDSYNNSDTRGNSPSYGTNYQKLGHELMSRDELGCAGWRQVHPAASWCAPIFERQVRPDPAPELQVHLRL